MARRQDVVRVSAGLVVVATGCAHHDLSEVRKPLGEPSLVSTTVAASPPSVAVAEDSDDGLALEVVAQTTTTRTYTTPVRVFDTGPFNKQESYINAAEWGGGGLVAALVASYVFGTTTVEPSTIGNQNVRHLNGVAFVGTTLVFAVPTTFWALAPKLPPIRRHSHKDTDTTSETSLEPTPAAHIAVTAPDGSLLVEGDADASGSFRAWLALNEHPVLPPALAVHAGDGVLPSFNIATTTAYCSSQATEVHDRIERGDLAAVTAEVVVMEPAPCSPVIDAYLAAAVPRAALTAERGTTDEIRGVVKAAEVLVADAKDPRRRDARAVLDCGVAAAPWFDTWDNGHQGTSEEKLKGWAALLRLSADDTRPTGKSCAVATIASLDADHTAEVSKVEAEEREQERLEAEREGVCPGLQSKRVAVVRPMFGSAYVSSLQQGLHRMRSDVEKRAEAAALQGGPTDAEQELVGCLGEVGDAANTLLQGLYQNVGYRPPSDFPGFDGPTMFQMNRMLAADKVCQSAVAGDLGESVVGPVKSYLAAEKAWTEMGCE